MTVHVSQTPGGAGASVSKVGLLSTSQMRKCGRRVGKERVGRDGTELLAPWTMNHVRSKSWPENLTLTLHNWGCKLDLNPAEVQGHGVLEVVTVIKCVGCAQ